MYYLYCKYTKDLHEVDVLVYSIIINSSIINTGGVICESLLSDVQRPHYYFHFFIFPTVRPYICTYSVFRKKLCFFTIHCNPCLAYIAVRDHQSSQRNESVQSLLLAGSFCTTNSSRVLARERWQTLQNSREKNTQYLMNTL